jgi:hypothetical protein
MPMRYESTVTIDSEVSEGVRFTIARMTFGRRIDLMRRVRQLSAQLEFEKAGPDVRDRLQASLLGAEIDELYLRWGLKTIEGLELDGCEPSIDSLIALGPEALCREIIAAIKRECSLTEEERKN